MRCCGKEHCFGEGIECTSRKKAFAKFSSQDWSLPESVEVYDTTLRDGNQSVGVNFTSTQKQRVAEAVIAAGVDFVEGGWPNATNPVDCEFFNDSKSLDRETFSRLTAFGMTRRANTRVEDDSALAQLLSAGTRTVTIFGKSWSFQVEKVIGTTLEENLRMVEESIAFLKSHKRRVIFDAEHFFDGFKANPTYALSVLKTARLAGASVVVLCDTRGAALPTEIADGTRSALNENEVPVGIHCHNDRGLASANTLFAVMSGASHVQGTINGLGERVGNADLVQVVANLHLMGIRTRLQLRKLTALSRFVCDMSGTREDRFSPFVGEYAFAHKGGVHGDAVLKARNAYEFWDPSVFGNRRSITVSSQAGRSSLLEITRKLGFNLSRDHAKLSTLLREVKRFESQGCNLENAQASLELLILRNLSRVREPFRIVSWQVNVKESGAKGSARSRMVVKIKNRLFETQADGNGPVNALDEALRRVLRNRFRSAFSAKLAGYRVREIDSEAATAANVAVYIDFVDDHRTWTTVSSSTNIIQASVAALVDGYVYSLTQRKCAKSVSPRK